MMRTCVGALVFGVGTFLVLVVALFAFFAGWDAVAYDVAAAAFMTYGPISAFVGALVLKRTALRSAGVALLMFSLVPIAAVVGSVWR